MTGPLRDMDRSTRVGKQIVLPWRQSIHICASGIKTRLGRSVLTLSGVALAVAFFASMMTTSHITDTLVVNGDANTLFALAQATGIDVNDESARERQRQRDYWLIGLSLLVALVGIVNSVLMSVSERVREIGTMKCLGALDSFVVRLFFLESAFAGLIGAGVGAPIGIVLAGVRMGFAVGFTRLAWGPFLQDGLWTWVLSLLIGTVITILAAIYPAYVAARMQPVEAMRVEDV